MADKTRVPVLAMHSHFHIFRNVNEAHEGPVSLDEQIKALERFVRWHERQRNVGQSMLDHLVTQLPKPVVPFTDPDADAAPFA